jgi:hypothetical protein
MHRNVDKTVNNIDLLQNQNYLPKFFLLFSWFPRMQPFVQCNPINNIAMSTNTLAILHILKLIYQKFCAPCLFAPFAICVNSIFHAHQHEFHFTRFNLINEKLVTPSLFGLFFS